MWGNYPGLAPKPAMPLVGLSQTLCHWVAASCFGLCPQPFPSPVRDFFQRNSGLALETGMLVKWGKVIRQAVCSFMILNPHPTSDVHFILSFVFGVCMMCIFYEYS